MLTYLLSAYSSTETGGWCLPLDRPCLEPRQPWKYKHSQHYLDKPFDEWCRINPNVPEGHHERSCVCFDGDEYKNPYNP